MNAQEARNYNCSAGMRMTSKSRTAERKRYQHVFVLVGVAPTTWTKLDNVVQHYYYREMRIKFPALRYCSANWKATSMLLIHTPNGQDDHAKLMTRM
jgi:hypothetical protein